MPTGVYERPLRLCGIENCNNKHFAKGLCKKCWNKQYNKQYCKEHKTERKQYLKDNKKHTAIRAKKYYGDNKEHYSKYHEQYYQKNKECIAMRIKRYRNTLKGKAGRKVHTHNRRALEKGLTKEIIQQVYEANIAKYGVLTCYLCGKPIIEGDKNLKDSLDHSTPLTREGTNKYENLGISHLKCNLQKGTKTLKEFSMVIGEKWNVGKN